MNEHNFNEIIIKELPNKFGGSERKKTVVIDNEIYLLKLPDPVREQGRSLSYINNAVSEYLGCHILASLGFEVQETSLGTYYDKEKKKTYIACTCKDVGINGWSLGEIANISLSDSFSKYAENTTLESVDIIASKISATNAIKKEDIINFYYNLLIADLLIGNTDRHNRNWGILTHPINSSKIAPVFDCGSSLSPLLSDEDLIKINRNNIAKDETSVLHNDKTKRLKWVSILSLDNEYTPYIEDGAKRIVPKICLPEIFHIIENTPYISDERKQFYKDILQIRYEQILLPYLDKVCNKNITKCELENPYQIYTKIGLNKLNINESIQVNDLFITKVSNRYALIYDDKAEYKGIIPVRSNNDEIKKAVAVIRDITYNTPDKEQSLTLEVTNYDDI